MRGRLSLRYHIVEISPKLEALQREKLAEKLIDLLDDEDWRVRVEVANAMAACKAQIGSISVTQTVAPSPRSDCAQPLPTSP